MPDLDGSAEANGSSREQGFIPFSPVTRDHILHCSYDYWFPKYRTSCIRSRIIQVPLAFVEYLREDGIILADDDETQNEEEEEEWEPSFPFTSQSEDAAQDADPDEEPRPTPLPPNQRFPELHQTIKDKIAELGGAVCPKLNWSAPKDAAWISRHQNTMKCTTPNDVYLLLKSSSFISHDLEVAFDGCVPGGKRSRPGAAAGEAPPTTSTTAPVRPLYSPVLVLRAFFNPHPALEFRCFVKHRTLVAVSARDLNYYPFLPRLLPAVLGRARELFDRKLRFSFPEGSFAFDVYIPDSDGDNDDDDCSEGRLGRARLIDINPWAPRTDPLLFDWQELLAIRVPQPMLGAVGEDAGDGQSLVETEEEDTADEDEEEFVPELRLVEEQDPAAYNFSSPQYSAHKLPKEVVDASLEGQGGMREFAERWSRIMAGQETSQDREPSDYED